jgi:hypothetical protein
MDALAIVWFWLLITVAADLFRRHDITGWIKAQRPAGPTSAAMNSGALLA